MSDWQSMDEASAIEALKSCTSLTECMALQSKANVMVSYAKQMKDETLRSTAVRIRARAMRRLGELLTMHEGEISWG